MTMALEECNLLGIYTNQSLLRQIVNEEFFKGGQTFIDTIDNWDFGQRPVPSYFADVAATIFAGGGAPIPETIGGLGNWRMK